jgi:hypothetical protein
MIHFLRDSFYVGLIGAYLVGHMLNTEAKLAKHVILFILLLVLYTVNEPLTYRIRLGPTVDFQILLEYVLIVIAFLAGTKFKADLTK